MVDVNSFEGISKLQDMLSIVGPADLPQVDGSILSALESLACSVGLVACGTWAVERVVREPCLDLGTSGAAGLLDAPHRWQARIYPVFHSPDRLAQPCCDSFRV